MLSTVELPTFDGSKGSNPQAWVMKMEYFWAIDKFSEEDKLNVVALLVEGRVYKWFIGVSRRDGFRNWQDFKQQFIVQFAELADVEPVIGVLAIHSTSSVADYGEQLKSFEGQMEASKEQVQIYAEQVQKLNEHQGDLHEILSVAKEEITPTEILVKQHFTVAEAAVAGGEKVDAEEKYLQAKLGAVDDEMAVADKDKDGVDKRSTWDGRKQIYRDGDNVDVDLLSNGADDLKAEEEVVLRLRAEQARSISKIDVVAGWELAIETRMVQGKKGTKSILDKKEQDLDSVLQTFPSFPPIIFAGEARHLEGNLGPATMGQMPVNKVGRMARQFAKLRSDSLEERSVVKLPSYRGDNINGDAFDSKSGIPNPLKMISVYCESAATLNLLLAFATGGYAALQRVTQWNHDFTEQSEQGDRYRELARCVDQALGFMHAVGRTLDHPIMHTNELQTSYECLLLPYEQSLTRIDSTSGLYNDYGAHIIWVGNQTRKLDGAHVEFVRGVANLLGVKVSDKMDPKELVQLIEILNTDNKSGRVDNPPRDSWVYLATCHIGHHVEVHQQKGSVYSGIFHDADVENNVGIVLKMACWIREDLENVFADHGKRGRNPFEVAFVDTNSGDLYWYLSQLDEAICAHQISLTELTSAKGGNHPTVGSVYIRLADFHNRTGKVRDAQSYCANALRMYESHHLESSPEESASGLTDNSVICKFLYAVEQAITLLQKALQIYTASGQKIMIAVIMVHQRFSPYKLEGKLDFVGGSIDWKRKKKPGSDKADDGMYDRGAEKKNAYEE